MYPRADATIRGIIYIHHSFVGGPGDKVNVYIIVRHHGVPVVLASILKEHEVVKLTASYPEITKDEIRLTGLSYLLSLSYFDVGLTAR